jgi:hypothetical protein
VPSAGYVFGSSIGDATRFDLVGSGPRSCSTAFSICSRVAPNGISTLIGCIGLSADVDMTRVSPLQQHRSPC